jgi:hypothetical protein
MYAEIPQSAEMAESKSMVETKRPRRELGRGSQTIIAVSVCGSDEAVVGWECICVRVTMETVYSVYKTL